MSLRRKRPRKREQQRHHQPQPTRRFEPAHEVREVDDRWLLPSRPFGATRELDAVYGSALQARSDDGRDADGAPRTVPTTSRPLREASEVERLAYSRRQAAEALGVSISTIDRPHRSLHRHRQASLGSAAHTSRRARALPAQPSRASACSPSSTSCRSAAGASTKHRRADPS
jgi:hypothetical protein